MFETNVDILFSCTPRANLCQKTKGGQFTLHEANEKQSDNKVAMCDRAVPECRSGVVGMATMGCKYATGEAASVVTDRRL